MSSMQQISRIGSQKIYIYAAVQTEELNIFWVPEMKQSDWLESDIVDLDSIIPRAF